MLSFEQERERIFVRWLSALEQLLDRHLDRDAAYEAWADGYSVAEYAATSLEATTSRPSTFEEVVASQDPAEISRLNNGESFDDLTVRNPHQRQVSVHEDRHGTGDWRRWLAWAKLAEQWGSAQPQRSLGQIADTCALLWPSTGPSTGRYHFRRELRPAPL